MYTQNTIQSIHCRPSRLFKWPKVRVVRRQLARRRTAQAFSLFLSGDNYPPIHLMVISAARNELHFNVACWTPAALFSPAGGKMALDVFKQSAVTFWSELKIAIKARASIQQREDEEEDGRIGYFRRIYFLYNLFWHQDGGKRMG